MRSTRFSVFAIALSAGVFAGCSGIPSVNQATAGAANLPATAGSGSGGAGTVGTESGGFGAQAGNLMLQVPDPEDAAGSTSVGGSTSVPYPDTLPVDFTATDAFGGFKVGDVITPGSGPSEGEPENMDGCGTTILAVIRDFKSDGKNFEGNVRDDRNLVLPELGADHKPVLASADPTFTVKDPAQFSNWYRTVEGVNQAYKLELWFGRNNGVSSFQSTDFFPLDGKGFGDEGNAHNYHFTTEIHTRFKYEGGESFKFSGDDDVWVFINGKLAIDLGGVHGAEDAAIDIDERADELGLVKGKVYSFDMFQNERHTTQSNFRADTNLNFVDCGTIVPEPVIPK